MKALCPQCAGKGCGGCTDGYTPVHFAVPDVGHYHYYICNECETTGGWLHRPDRELPDGPRGDRCPGCGIANLRLSACADSFSVTDSDEEP